LSKLLPFKVFRITIMVDGDSSLGPQALNLSDEAIRHAFDNALVQLDFDADEHPPRYALVGSDRAATMIELVVIIGDNDRRIVIHAMNARPRFLALLDHPGDSS
jgi:hypothetical protein